jgi:hypothetical protein
MDDEEKLIGKTFAELTRLVVPRIPDNPQIAFDLPTLIKHEEEGEVIYQRVQDGYVNATTMCKAGGKEWFDYFKQVNTKEFLEELSDQLKIPIKPSRGIIGTALISTIQGGYPEQQGTWVHPQVAINLGQWVSPRFAVKVSKWVFDWMSGKARSNNIPYHLRRYGDNRHKIPNGYFSILQEMILLLVEPLERQGYILPSNILPDISEGKMFSSFLKKNGINTDEMPTYKHRYEDGRVVDAKIYPNEYLFAFREHVLKVWLPTRATKYFAERDKSVLPLLGNIMLLGSHNTSKLLS